MSEWRCSSVFIVNFEQILHIVLLFLLLTLNKLMTAKLHKERYMKNNAGNGFK